MQEILVLDLLIYGIMFHLGLLANTFSMLIKVPLSTQCTLYDASCSLVPAVSTEPEHDTREGAYDRG